MHRQFSTNIIFLISINLLIKPFFIFGIDRDVQNVVGTSSYGVYFALINFTIILQILNDFGIQNFNNRAVAQDNQLIHKYFYNILLLKIFLAAVFFGAVFIAAQLAGYDINYAPLLAFIATNQVLTSLILFFRSNISGLGLYRTDSIISAADKLLMIILCGILLWTPTLREQFRIEWFAIAQTITLTITAFISYFIIRGKVTRPSFRFRLPLLIQIVRQSAPYAMVILLMTIYTRIDAVMIERLLPDGAYQSGAYGAAYRLLDASSMFGYLFASLLLPMFASLLSRHQSVAPLLQYSFKLLWAGAITLSAAVFWHRQEVMELLYTAATPLFGNLLGWLIISFPAVAGTYIYGTLITANGNLKALNRIFLFSIALNITLNLWWIPTHKAEGAALATLITQSIVFLAQVILAHRLLPHLASTWSLLFRIIAYTIATFGAGFLLHHTGSHMLISFVVSLFSGLILAILFRLVEFRLPPEVA